MMTPAQLADGIDRWRKLHAAGQGSRAHTQMCEHWQGWCFRHGHALLNLAAAQLGEPGVEPLEQNMTTVAEVSFVGTRPAVRETTEGSTDVEG